MAVRIECIADTFIEQDARDVNNGDYTAFGYQDWTDSGYDFYKEALIKFQTLPQGTYSKIYMYLRKTNDSDYSTPKWKKMNSSWDEMTATWNNTNRNYTSITVDRIATEGLWWIFDVTEHYNYLSSNNNGFALVPWSGERGWFKSKESDYPPYIIAYTSDDILPPYNLQPVTEQAGQVTFNWDADSSYTAYEIQYKQGDDDWTTITKKTLNSAELNNGKVIWRVRINNNGTWSEWSVPVEFDFTRVFLEAPTNLQPTSNQKGTVTISWDNVEGNYPSNQVGYEIQYSYNQINWQTITGTGSTTQHTIPAGTFQFEGDSVTIYYRVRVKNNYGLWSEWSDSSSFLYYSSNPKKPIDVTLTQNAGDIVVAWTYVPNDAEEQSGADIEYSFDNTNWTTLVHTGSSTTYTIAEEKLDDTTITNRTVYVRIRTKNAIGGISEYSDTKTIDYKTSKPAKPSNLQPFGQQIEGGEVIATWQFNNTGRGETQKAFELQYKCEDDTEWTTVTGGTESQYTFSNLTAGIVLWKVRVQSTLNVWSDWSTEASFTYITKPEKPTIISSNVFEISHPVISWTSNGQTAFRIQVVDTELYFDTQEITSSATSYTLEKALENKKTYKIRLSIKNRFGLWSDWAEQTVTTTFAEPNQPSFRFWIDYNRASVHIHISNPVTEEVATNEVYRRRYDETEWTKIGETEVNGEFIDYTLTHNTQYEYEVRALTAEGGYKDSDIQNTSVKVKNTQLANTQDYTQWVELKYNPSRTHTKTYTKTLVHYAGRTKPVVIRGQQQNWTMQLSFVITKEEVVNALLDLVDTQEILLLRDSRGRNKYVFITSEPQITEQINPRIWEVSFEVTEVDYDD